MTEQDAAKAEFMNREIKPMYEVEITASQGETKNERCWCSPDGGHTKDDHVIFRGYV